MWRLSITSDTKCRHAITQRLPHTPQLIPLHTNRVLPASWLEACHRPISNAIRADKLAHIRHLAMQAKHATDAFDTHKLNKTIRRFQKAFAPPLSNADGVPILSDTTRAQAFAEYFAALQNGTPMTPDLSTLPTTCNTITPRHANHIYPTANDVARAIHKLIAKKAPGHDGIPSDILRTCSDVLRPHIHPRNTKTIATGHETTTWRGTIAIPTPKGANANMPLTHPLHRHLCGHITPVLSNHTLPSQCGGLMARSSDFGAHIVRQLHGNAHYQNRTLLTIYVDFNAAFDAITRSSF